MSPAGSYGIAKGGALNVNRASGEMLAISAVFIAALAVSQEFPSKPTRIISPFAPGGATDTLGRALAPPLSRTLGQNVIVENRPGASTAIGTEAAARAPADGHTLLVISPTYTPTLRSQALLREPLVKHGLSPAPMTPEQFTAFIHTEMDRNGRIVKLLNLKMD